MTTARDVIAKCWDDKGALGLQNADVILRALLSAGYAVVPIKATEAMINPSTSAQEWRPIETALFESAKRFWLGRKDAVPIIAWRYYHDGPWLSEGINVDAYQPTHWLPLPAPPSEDK